MAARPSAKAPLDQGRIVAAAVELADAGGVDALSMRRLANAMGYGVMSLYNHVADKDELLALMVDSVAAEVDDAPAGAAPLEAVRLIALASRAAFVAHPWAPIVWQRHLPGPARSQVMEHLLRHFAESELSPELAHHGFHAVNNHVLGYTLQALSMSMGDDDPEASARDYLARVDGEFPLVAAHTREHIEGRTSPSFELVLDLILDGLVRLDRESRRRASD